MHLHLYYKFEAFCTNKEDNYLFFTVLATNK